MAGTVQYAVGNAIHPVTHADRLSYVIFILISFLLHVHALLETSDSSSSSSYWRKLELPHPLAVASLLFFCFFAARRDTSMEFTISNASSKISITLLLLSLLLAVVVGE